VITLAASPDGKYLAVGASEAIHLLDATNLAPVRIIEASGTPVWSLAFTFNSKALLTAGADHVVRDWSVATGNHFGAAVTGQTDSMAEFAGNPDAETFRACIACHTLHPNDGQRAGPTLHGIFGRRIASVPGYPYSPALRDMDIVWTEETVSKLFELGPNTYTPGTKMPEQTIRDADTRAALIRFLQRATKTE
jgi:cytochrome c